MGIKKSSFSLTEQPLEDSWRWSLGDVWCLVELGIQHLPQCSSPRRLGATWSSQEASVALFTADATPINPFPKGYYGKTFNHLLKLDFWITFSFLLLIFCLLALQIIEM